jgi:hypothetical protein
MKFKRGFEKLNQDSEPTIMKSNTLKYVATDVCSSLIVLGRLKIYGMMNTFR